MTDESQPQVILRLTILGTGNPRSVVITGLTQEEQDGITSGEIEAGIANGRIYLRPKRAVEDIRDEEYWPTLEPPKDGVQLEMRVYDRETTFSPSIYIEDLCGYHRTPERYKEEANKLEGYGFECMRSKKGSDCKRWETWYLPGLWAAEGELKEQLNNKVEIRSYLDVQKEDEMKVKTALNFLRENVLYGSLSVVNQRQAMPVPE